MEIIKTKIKRIFKNRDYILYCFMVCNSSNNRNYVSLSVVNYSKESDFVSNYLGANDELKFDKEVYLVLKEDNSVLSISDSLGNTLVPELRYSFEGRMNTNNGEYLRSNYGLTIDEYSNIVKNEIKNRESSLKLKKIL